MTGRQLYGLIGDMVLPLESREEDFSQTQSDEEAVESPEVSEARFQRINELIDGFIDAMPGFRQSIIGVEPDSEGQVQIEDEKILDKRVWRVECLQVGIQEEPGSLVRQLTVNRRSVASPASYNGQPNWDTWAFMEASRFANGAEAPATNEPFYELVFPAMQERAQGQEGILIAHAGFQDLTGNNGNLPTSPNEADHEASVRQLLRDMQSDATYSPVESPLLNTPQA